MNHKNLKTKFIAKNYMKTCPKNKNLPKKTIMNIIRQNRI
jgi:hypothetical protein